MFRYGNDFNILQVAKCSIKVELVNDSYSELRGEIAGPPDTPYQGGNFHLEIKIPETYPFNPPKVSSCIACANFITNIWYYIWNAFCSRMCGTE